MRRKLFHLLGGSFFPALSFFLPRDLVILGLGAVLAAAIVFEVARFAFPAFGRFLFRHLGDMFKSEERSRLTGSTYLLVSSLLVFGIFPCPVAATAILFLSLGDPAASLVGQRWGRIRVGQKSLEGSLAFFVVASACGLALARSGLGPPAPAVPIGAFAAALTELLPSGLDDNLVVPLVGAVAMTAVGILLS